MRKSWEKVGSGNKLIIHLQWVSYLLLDYELVHLALSTQDQHKESE